VSNSATPPLRAPKPISALRAVAVFLLAGLLVVVLLGVVLAWAQRQTATAEAIRDARTLTNLESGDVVGPLLTDAALVPGPAQSTLDAVVRGRVLGSRIVRVKIWDADGRIVYSDDRTLIGRRFPMAADEKAVLATGATAAEVSDLGAAENLDEKQFGTLLQVYQGVHTPGGTPLLFETYQPYTVITDASRRMWLTSLPVLLGGLVLLYVLQAPLAYRMARRLQRSQEEREALLLRTLSATDRERAAIAADLHDGVVQELAGTSFALAAEADRAAATHPDGARVMRSAAADLRRWVRELRSLIVTIVPPALHAQGLRSTLTDLAATLEARGIAVTVAVDDVGPLDETSEVLVYRAAQEAVRNVVRHAGAAHVRIAVVRDGRGTLRLTVRDDGSGLDEGYQTARRRGSVGLDLLGQLVAAHGGQLTVGNADGGGVEMVVVLPDALVPAGAGGAG
jgi:two-component system NarL family sensor kinase